MVDQKDLRVIISIMVLCDANAITEYDRRRRSAWLSSAPLDMEYDNSHSPKPITYGRT